jgi:selenocysteine lyase/cysteine desulfurase
VPHPTAERFEPGAHNLLGIFGLDAALELLLEAQPEHVEAQVVALRDLVARRLQELGCRLLWTPDSLPGGIVTFQPPKESAAAFHERTQSRLTVSLRQDRNGEHWIRVSPHFMNDEDDVEAICALLAA